MAYDPLLTVGIHLTFKPYTHHLGLHWTFLV